MKFVEAKRENTYTLTSIAGPSGSGKTYSALLYARGLVGPNEKIALIDTENKRSRHYSNVAGGFTVADLRPPFSPSRYTELIQHAEQQGFKACIVDSMSHEWEGLGGCLEIADTIESKTGKPGLHCWKQPKLQHKKLMNTLLQAQMHLIFCCRVKEVVRQEKDGNRTVIVKDGYAAIQEKGFIYEMTLSMMLHETTHVPQLTKCPEDLLTAFPAGQLVTTTTGELVRKWSEEGEQVDEDSEKLFDIARSAANLGSDKFKAWFKEQSPADRQTLKRSIMAEIESICLSADETNAVAEEAEKLAAGEVETMDLRANLPEGVKPASELFPDENEEATA